MIVCCRRWLPIEGRVLNVGGRRYEDGVVVLWWRKEAELGVISGVGEYFTIFLTLWLKLKSEVILSHLFDF